MGANTTYYVEVVRTYKVLMEVQAVTADEAAEQARRSPEVVAVGRVMHWSEVEEAERT